MMIVILLVAVVVVILMTVAGNEDLKSRVLMLEKRVQILEEGGRVPVQTAATSRLSSPKPAPLPPVATPPVVEKPIIKEEPKIKPADGFIPKPAFKPVPAFNGPVGNAKRTVPEPSLNWENFMGVKLFAWLGGFALFLGAVFFVKYSLDHNLISPLMRICIGMLVGLGAIIGGLAIQRDSYRVTAQTLCAAGVAVLYADLYAAHALYHFIPDQATFGFMVLVTAVSFLLAVRLNSIYVAILGLVGGFLTPVALSTGVDHPAALFSYLLLLDAGLSAVALHQRWGFLMVLSMCGTLLMECGWTSKFLTGDKGLTATAIYAACSLFFLLTAEIARRRNDKEEFYPMTAAGSALLSMGFVAHFLSSPTIAGTPSLTLGLLLFLGSSLAYVAGFWEDTKAFYYLGGFVSFILLMTWTDTALKPDLLLPALGFYLLFAIVHGFFPTVLQRYRPSAALSEWSFYAPLAVLFVTVLALVVIPKLTFLIWPFIFVLTLIAIAASWLAGSLLAVLGTFAMALASFGIWIFRLPDAAGLPDILALLAFFSCGFFAFACVISGKRGLSSKMRSASMGMPSIDAEHLPAIAAFMPFLLLGMMAVQLPLQSPTDLFALASLLLALIFGLVAKRRVEGLMITALLATALVEYAWHLHRFASSTGLVAPLWTLVFYAVFLVAPLVLSRHFSSTEPWLVSAFSGPVHFMLMYWMWHARLGASGVGGLPALLALPSLVTLAYHINSVPASDTRRSSILAMSGGVALFFITLIIPLQWSNEWISLGWALEGAALVWLYRRVPHEGLIIWGMGLLSTAFVRLAMNPGVLSYHPRTGTPFFNWYLGVYGASALACFAAAAWSTSFNKEWEGMKIKNVLMSFGVILLFLLLNIEMADYFSTGATITFEFSGNVARDLAYSLSWAGFATVLLIIGLQRESKGVRYASIALLTATLGKLFLHDLWSLGGLYRVASFVGLAIVLILVSFLYQWFASGDKTSRGLHE